MKPSAVFGALKFRGKIDPDLSTTESLIWSI